MNNNPLDYQNQKKQIIIHGVVIFFQLLFGLSLLLVSSGQFAYLGAWLLFSFYLLSIILYGFLLPKEVVLRRSVKQGKLPTYEKIMRIPMLILGYGVYVVAGLDQRYSWSSAIPWYMMAIAGFIFFLGMGIVLWSMIENPFFNRQVSVSETHDVIVSGPYSVIRHPGYLGMMTYLAVVPVILQSLYAMIPTVVLIILFIMRTIYEDRYLEKHLPGYQEYQKIVKKRLFRTY